MRAPADASSSPGSRLTPHWASIDPWSMCSSTSCRVAPPKRTPCASVWRMPCKPSNAGNKAMWTFTMRPSRGVTTDGGKILSNVRAQKSASASSKQDVISLSSSERLGTVSRRVTMDRFAAKSSMSRDALRSAPTKDRTVFADECSAAGLTASLFVVFCFEAL